MIRHILTLALATAVLGLGVYGVVRRVQRWQWRRRLHLPLVRWDGRPQWWEGE